MSSFKKIRCEICGKNYSRKDSLKRHIQSIHEDTDTESETSTRSSTNEDQQITLPKYIVERIIEILSKYV